MCRYASLIIWICNFKLHSMDKQTHFKDFNSSQTHTLWWIQWQHRIQKQHHIRKCSKEFNESQCHFSCSKKQKLFRANFVWKSFNELNTSFATKITRLTLSVHIILALDVYAWLFDVLSLATTNLPTYLCMHKKHSRYLLTTS